LQRKFGVLVLTNGNHSPKKMKILFFLFEDFMQQASQISSKTGQPTGKRGRNDDKKDGLYNIF
jgi:hypothetical protein